MEAILLEHEVLEKKANLQKAVDDVQHIIDLLKTARNGMQANVESTPMTLVKLQSPVKLSLDKVNEDLKEIYGGLNKYSKAVERKFKEKPLPFAENDALSSHPFLINRAIAMHLLREGLFDVATTFIDEVNASPAAVPSSSQISSIVLPGDHANQLDPAQLTQLRKGHQIWEADFAPSAFESAKLQREFSEMYHILHELRASSNLEPAIAWARSHSVDLEARGSHLEYDLCRLRYISLFTSTKPSEGPLAAITYARATFPSFPERYSAQTYALLGALAFTPGVQRSPYATLFSSFTDSSTTATAAAAFTSEFCALLDLSSASPLLTAVTAGCIALPTLLKLSQIQALHRTSWTTASELPVEVLLPPAYHFHSVFVCPVSKEQSTDTNPPMMMPCGHVVARESLEKLSKGARFKCPYCPIESHPKDAKMVFL